MPLAASLPFLCLTLAVPAAAAPLDDIQSAMHVATPFMPELPPDVNIDALRRLSDTPDKSRPPFSIPDGNIPPANRLFDVFAWQTFLALNWPTKPDSQPDRDKTLADTEAPRVWEHYVDAGLVYQVDGVAPASWEEAVKATWSNHVLWMSGMGIGKPGGPKGTWSLII